MKKAIVTGANGFIGKFLIKELLADNIEVYAVDRKSADWSNWLSEKVTKIECDLSDTFKLPNIISDRDIDCLINLAWAGVSGADREDYSLQLKNAQYTCDLVKAAAEMNIKRFVGAGTLAQLDGLHYIGKDGSTPNLVSCYGSAKTAAQFMSKALANSLRIEHIWCYISNIYGIGDTSNNFINFACKKLLNGERASFTAGEQNYDFVYVTDTIKGLYLCAQNGKPNHSYYIGSGHARKLKEYISIIRNAIDKNIPLYLGEVPFNGILLPIETFSCEHITADTGYIPSVDFETGIQKTIQWLKEESISASCQYCNNKGIEKTTEWIKEENIMAAFKIEPIDIGGYIIDNFFADDNRGSFTKLFEQKIFAEQGVVFHCSESFVSRSDKNVVRGMHFQTFHPQAKLVSVLSGKIYDVIVDLRKESDTYGQWRGFYLSSENHKGLLVPRGFAHGFLSLEDNTEVLYQCDGAYDKETDTGIIFSDKDVGIKWPADVSSLTAGERDKALMTFKEFDAEYSFTYDEKRGGGV